MPASKRDTWRALPRSARSRRRAGVEAPVPREPELELELELEPAPGAALAPAAESASESAAEPEAAAGLDQEREWVPPREVPGVEAGAPRTAVELLALARTRIPTR